MTIKQLKELIDEQYKRNKAGNVAIYLGNNPLEISRMGRFAFNHDLVIHLKAE